MFIADHRNCLFEGSWALIALPFDKENEKVALPFDKENEKVFHVHAMKSSMGVEL